ncbi:MAG: GntR family transcriptional regulator, partial [Acidobacteria bacterium]|nr:GntR family transcriptional regulator [Acidobacteriota bacterium]
MKSPIRKAVPGKHAEAKSREIKPESGRAARGDQRGLHAVGHASTHQRRGESLGDFAYRTMREAIRSGKFKSGQHLREADVAKWLNISRTPVREAFHRIVSEGLLTN